MRALLVLLIFFYGCSGFSPSSTRIALTTRNPIESSTRRNAFFSKNKTNNSSASIGTGSTTNSAKTDQTTKSANKAVMRSTEGMPNLEQEMDLAGGLTDAEFSLEKLLVPLGLTAVAAAGATALLDSGLTVQDASNTLAQFQADPQGFLQASLDGLGPLAIVYFGVLYIAAELLALPATPLTLSAGYLFGVAQGTAAVLIAGTISACIGFLIGKTFLRGWVENLLEENPQFKKLDKAIGAEGFKLLVLVRLSPIFPFSLLNYTYGASSISFPTFVAGTILGFAPSTLGYVYTGLVGKELLSGEGTQPWYVYAAGVSLLFGFLKLVTDVATDVVEAIEEEG